METEKPASAQRPTDSTRTTSPWIAWILRILSVGGMAIAVYLVWISLSSGQVAGCGGESIWDCSSVLQSRWSKWLGLPVSLPAASIYATLLVALCFVGAKAPEKLRRIAWSIVTLLAMMAAGAAIWFIYLQFFVLHGLCLYCMAAHTIGLIIFAIVLVTRPILMRSAMKLSGVAAVGISVLIAGQVLYEPPIQVEKYADDATDVEESDEMLIMSPIDGSDVMDLSLPDEAILDDDASEVAQPQEQAADKPGASSSKVDASPHVASPSPDKSDVDFISSKKSMKPPVPSLTPLPADETGSTESEASEEPAAENAEKTEEIDEKEPPKAPKERQLTVLGGRARLAIKGRPLVGSPDAKYVLVELFDYTCQHCRDLHRHLNAARKRYGDQLAVLTLVVPLNTKCNSVISSTSHHHRNACELARYSLAVWRHKPEAYESYHNWLFEPFGGRDPRSARTKAEKLIGEENLDKELRGDILDIYLGQHAGLYKRAGKGSIPKLLSATFNITGQVYSVDSLCRQLEQNLDLKRQDR